MFYKARFDRDINIKVIDRNDEVINAKIDTGATEILIPFHYINRLSTIPEAEIRKLPKKEFISASGCTITGYKTLIILKILGFNGCFRKNINVYFYDTQIIGKGILFGLIAIKECFKFCIDKEEFTLQINH